MSDFLHYESQEGTWQVVSLLGQGSFSKVYKVCREENGETCYSAVKVISIPYDEATLQEIRNQIGDDAYFQDLITDVISEINLINRFRGSSHIMSIEDHKVVKKEEGPGWDIFMRMELLQSLSGHEEEIPLTCAETVKLGIHICRALELYAQKNIIHRDIKPSNIFVASSGDYLLGDSGIARKIEHFISGSPGEGTALYMAPEVVKGEEYDAGVDTYSLGILMYRLLNQNCFPFMPECSSPMPGDLERALERRMSGDALPNLKGISPELNALVLKACAYDRDRRFFHPQEMREALEAIETDPEAVNEGLQAGAAEDVAQEDAAREDTAQEDAEQEDAEQEDAEQEDAVREDAAQEDAAQEDAVQEDAEQEDAVPVASLDSSAQTHTLSGQQSSGKGKISLAAIAALSVGLILMLMAAAVMTHASWREQLYAWLQGTALLQTLEQTSDSAPDQSEDRPQEQGPSSADEDMPDEEMPDEEMPEQDPENIQAVNHATESPAGNGSAENGSAGGNSVQNGSTGTGSSEAGVFGTWIGYDSEQNRLELVLRSDYTYSYTISRAGAPRHAERGTYTVGNNRLNFKSNSPYAGECAFLLNKNQLTLARDGAKTIFYRS